LPLFDGLSDTLTDVWKITHLNSIVMPDPGQDDDSEDEEDEDEEEQEEDDG
jgi:hypothetical protein